MEGKGAVMLMAHVTGRGFLGDKRFDTQGRCEEVGV